MRIKSSGGNFSSNTRWIRKQELRFFMMLPVWLCGLRALWKECFLPLHDRILKLWKTNGSLWVTQYLALASRIIVLWVGQQPYVQTQSSVRVALTRSGLPTILPGPLRKIFHLLRGDDHAYALLVIRVTLTLLSVYRVIGCAPILKMDTITGPFSGASITLAFWEVSQAVGLLPRSLVLGKLTWNYISESAGPNFKRSSWGSGLDALAFLRDPLTWYHWLVIAIHQKAYVLIAWNLLCVGLTLPLVPILMICGKIPRFLGRLTTLFEARGKVRVVAITDWWTQVLLKPLHLGIFNILRSIPQDGTFDQLAPVQTLIAYVRASGSPVFSYDLSAATDRLPVAFQMQVLESLGIKWACNWAALLVARPWFLKGKAVFYSVGQPMGALSSWAMLALSHHVLVQIAARRVNWDGWFPHYALLGDDIVIADAGVAKAYLDVMQSLGVPINLSKSFEIEKGTCEFAKRWLNPHYGDLSPMSPGLILATLRNPRMTATLLRDSLGRSFIFSTHVWRDLVRFLSMIRSRKWLQSQLKPILSSAFGPTGGFWVTASGPFFKAAWIKLFPALMANKVDRLIEMYFRLVAESQSPPPSEEDLKNQLISNFWKRAVLFGSGLWGVISAPLLIISPAFWVYYDLASRAEEAIADFKSRSNYLDHVLTVGEWFFVPGSELETKAKTLDSLVKSTFDPGLLEWDRLQAEKLVHIHSQLFKAVDREIAVAEYMAEFVRTNSSAPEVEIVPLRFYRTVPSHRALVQLGYWGFRPTQKWVDRILDIPQSGAPS